MVHLSRIAGVELLNDDNLLSQLAELFSTNYGIWSEKGPRPGELVIMSVRKMKELLLFDVNATGVVVARLSPNSSRIVAYSFYYIFNTESLGKVCWITQLVTCGAVRHSGLATSVIRAVLDSDDFAACGLVSSHPYAIRALEKATSCKCDQTMIKKYAAELIKNCKVPYIKSDSVIDEHGSINTEFHVDHKDRLEIIQIERNAGRWNFGELLNGHEFFVVVFMGSTKDDHKK